jgi:putative spermidine/putrescine transport system permease protein
VKRLAFTAVVAAAVLAPFLALALWSVSRRWFYPHLLPEAWGTRAWSYLFETAGAQTLEAVVQSVKVAAATALLAVAGGVPAGRALGLYHFRGKQLVSVLLMLPVIVPPLCVTMGFHLWMLQIGLAETFGGVVLVHLAFSLPYAVFVMWGVFSNFNPDYEEQARSLGATAAGALRRVTLPLVLPGLTVAALFAFLLSWSQYLSTLIIGGGKITTLPILLFALMASGDRPVAAAVSLVFVAPALAALALSARHLGGRRLPGVW